ncbi:thermonuclease family protein [Sphingomicrobium arenosum]|uniref:thermonuclease family protein n=1 Tax=Sphingomicrobium arenosum TaxID=2233861 RepID=UPI002240CE36|nr:thermonuclease family protein [Sphingomicrobium arenosum]
MSIALFAAAMVCHDPRVVDGDTIRCRDQGLVRMLAIDAPDRTSSRPCRQGRSHYVCDDAAARASTQSLDRMLVGRVTIHPVTRDRYGRMVARVEANGRDLSCAQIVAGHARYVERFDNSGLIAARCF